MNDEADMPDPDNRVTNIQLNATSTAAEVEAGFQAILSALQAPALPDEDVPAHWRLAPPAPPHLIVQHLKALATPPPRPRLYEEQAVEAGPELASHQARRRRQRELLTEAGTLSDDRRLGDEPPVPRLIQPEGLRTRAPRPRPVDPFDDDFFQPKPKGS